jgi:uncharacterized membrane protein
MSPHLLNIFVHIGAGIAGMAVGFYLLWKPKASVPHRRGGRVFAGLTLVVCASAAIGNVFFRFTPLFAVLTVLVTYQLLSGWHVIYTKAAGPDALDALLLLGGTAVAAVLLAKLFGAGLAQDAGISVVASSLAALGTVMAYDAARWLFPRRWHAALWRYEHVYKVVACLFGMLSAAVGNTIRAGQPWSQLAPSVAGIAVIVWFWTHNVRGADRLDSQASQATEEARCTSAFPHSY